MPQNSPKRPSLTDGCRTWVVPPCSKATEAQSGAAQRREDPAPGAGVLPDPGTLLRSAVHSGDLADADLARIDEELHQLLEARAYFQAWTKELRAEGAGGISPAQYLRAWNDSTARVVQLLRARRALAGEGDAQGPFGALITEVYDITDMLLPNPSQDGGKEGESGA
ncbi:MAG: hypothetical protein ACYC4R_02905 [Anaerolineae bacterium]